MDKNKLSIAYVPLDQLKPAPYNPRRISAKDFESLRNSLRTFGWAEPIVVNKRTGFIVGGHMRLNAAKALDLIDAPVVYVDLDPEHEKSLNLALNKISGDFDEDMLSELLLSLDDDLQELSGFDDDEIAKLSSDPFDDDTDVGVKDDKPKDKRYTTNELRTLAKGIYPAEAPAILDFLDVVDRASA